MTQRDRIRKMFMDRPGEWIPLPAILAMGVAQYGARILELRRLGMDIKNRGEWVGGQHRTYFRYLPQEKQGDLFIKQEARVG